MTVSELKAKLTEFEVPFEETANKADLQRVHDEAAEAGVFDGEQSAEEAVANEAAADSEVSEEEPTEEVEESEEPTEEYPEGTYEVVSRLNRDGQVYEAGESVALPSDVAIYLTGEGVVK